MAYLKSVSEYACDILGSKYESIPESAVRCDIRTDRRILARFEKRVDWLCEMDRWKSDRRGRRFGSRVQTKQQTRQ